MWTVEEFEHERRAMDLAADIGVTSTGISPFDKALASWLRSYGEVMSAKPYKFAELPGRPESSVDQVLAIVIDTLENDEKVYAWTRLLKANDALWGFKFGWGITGPLLRHHLDRAYPLAINWHQAGAATRYMTPDMADKSSSAYEQLWDLANRSGLLQEPRERQPTLIAFVDTITRRVYHHDLKGLDRLLRAVKDEDLQVQRRLRQFQPDNDQGAALIAGHVLRAVPLDSAASASHAAEILAWLVDARRKEPTKRWEKRRDELETAGASTLRTVCAEIGRHPEYARHEGTGWRDELFWFMWKTSAWYGGNEPRRILS